MSSRRPYFFFRSREMAEKSFVDLTNIFPNNSKKGACPGYSTPLARLAAGRSCQGRSQEFDLGVYGKTPSAEGARIKAPQAPSSEAPQAPRGVRCGEGLCPLPKIF